MTPVTVSNGVVSAFNTWLFTFREAAFHAVKGRLLQTGMKRVKTVSKSSWKRNKPKAPAGKRRK